MFEIKNVMEIIVKDSFDKVESQLDCCTCECCKSDILAYALNHLPSKYVTTKQGTLFAKLDAISLQHEVDVLTVLFKAAEIVKQNPRHSSFNDLDE